MKHSLARIVSVSGVIVIAMGGDWRMCQKVPPDRATDLVVDEA
jgi:hypothetical protein